MSAPMDTGPQLAVADARPGPSWGAVVAASCLSAALAAVACWMVTRRQVDRELAMRPRVVVIDSVGWITKAGQGPTERARMIDGAQKLKAAVDKLRGQGVLVLDSAAVRGAPDALRIDTPSAEGGSE